MLLNNLHDAAKDYIILNNRFGEFHLAPENEVVLPNGLIGLKNLQVYYLMPITNPKFNAFYLLNSKDDIELRFLTVPIRFLNFCYHPNDMETLINETGFNEEYIEVFLITTIHKSADHVLTFTANTQAPIVLCKKSKTAKQCVLMNEIYKTNMPL